MILVILVPLQTLHNKSAQQTGKMLKQVKKKSTGLKDIMTETEPKLVKKIKFVML